MRKGFTLIELLVSLALFSIVMTVCLGSVLVIIDSNSKAEAASAIMTNLQIGIDGMSREIRTGTNYSASGSSFSFVTQNGVPTTYSLVDAGDGTHFIQKQTTGDNAAILPITTDVDVTELSFTATGLSTTDCQQPKVLIIMKGEAGVKERLKVLFNIQTTVSQRLLDDSAQHTVSCS